MTLYGANPDELDHLGATLRRQISSIEAVVAQVGSALAGTTWIGPARDRFQADWERVFTGPSGALTRLNEAFGTAGTDCQRRAAELRRVMGAGAS
ncbi:MAG TPA: hypothetical protein VF855_07095 [Acidimicrobiales bacterium]